jgi:hypothetical protein
VRELWRWGNLGLAFGVELMALVVFAWWGWQAGGSTVMRLVLAVGLVVIAAVVWGMFAAPTARRSPLVRGGVKGLVFGLAAVALWDLGHPISAVAYVVVVAGNLLAIRLGNLTPELPAELTVSRD